MKKLVLLVSLVVASSTVLPSDASQQPATPAPTSMFSSYCPSFIQNAPSNVDAFVRNNPYWSMLFVAVAAVVATKVVEDYVASQELDEEYDI